MTTLAQKRTLFDALLVEPIELVISQPHQAFISSASVFLVAAEAAILIDAPYNVMLAIGAEWAYLKGLSSGQQVRTRWASALNWSAVILVVLYGFLWGLRKFGAIPDPPPVWGAILLTLIHILCIGAVTICSAMVHAAMLGEQRQRRDQQQAEQDARARRLQDEQDAIELERQRAQAQVQIEWQRRKADLALREAEQTSKMQMQNARQKMRGNAHLERANADGQKCPKCSAELDRAQWLAARRWGHCSNCKEVS